MRDTRSSHARSSSTCCHSKGKSNRANVPAKLWRFVLCGASAHSKYPRGLMMNMCVGIALIKLPRNPRQDFSHPVATHRRYQRCSPVIKKNRRTTAGRRFRRRQKLEKSRNCEQQGKNRDMTSGAPCYVSCGTAGSAESRVYDRLPHLIMAHGLIPRGFSRHKVYATQIRKRKACYGNLKAEIYICRLYGVN